MGGKYGNKESVVGSWELVNRNREGCNLQKHWWTEADSQLKLLNCIYTERDA